MFFSRSKLLSLHATLNQLFTPINILVKKKKRKEIMIMAECHWKSPRITGPYIMYLH